MLKATVIITPPTYPTKKVGMMKDIMTTVIMIKVSTIKGITTTGMAEDTATKVITAAIMAVEEGSVEEGAEDAL